MFISKARLQSALAHLDNPWAFALILFAGLYLAGIILAYPSLPYNWFFDDLILVRTFTNDEIAHAWTGDWDPSGISTPGYRPLTVLFNHLTSVIFGESVEFHRLFRIGVFAAYLTVVALAACEVGLARWQASLAGILILCTKNTWWILTWPADGIRAFAALFGALTAYLLLLHLKKPAWWKFWLGVLCFGTTLLVREDGLPFALIAPAMGLAFGVRQAIPTTGLPRLGSLQRWFRQVGKNFPGARSVFAYFLALLGVAALYWLLRTALVPAAHTTMPVNLEGRVVHLFWALFPRITFGIDAFTIPSTVVLWIAMIVFVSRLPPTRVYLALFWMCCIIVAASTGAVIGRANNLLVPASFFGLFLATIAGDFARRSRPAALLSAVIVLFFLSGSVIAHRTAQQTIHPLSTENLAEDRFFLWGKYAQVAMPPDRRAWLQAHYDQLGLHNEDDFQQFLTALRSNPETPQGPTADGEPFVPASPWLSGW